MVQLFKLRVSCFILKFSRVLLLLCPRLTFVRVSLLLWLVAVFICRFLAFALVFVLALILISNKSLVTFQNLQHVSHNAATNVELVLS